MGQRVEQTRREIADLGAGRRLYRFIAEREASDDYRKKLGVVSLIRQDFEELTRRLRARREEGADVELPTVERIVFYIDDLDRCPPERVVQVLEAVHLLLALDLFVVVVGVDPRWLLRSLQRQFRQVLSNRTTTGGGYWHSIPQEYLEKIFQIPLVLPPMTPPGFAALLRSLIRAPGTTGPTAATGVRPTETPSDPQSRTVQPAGELNQATLEAEAGSAAAQVAAGEAPEQLDLTDDELDFLTHLAPLVRTPRTAKRMLNIYRMLRVTRDLGPASQFLGDHDKAGDYQAIAQLLGILTAFPTLFSRLCWGDNDADTRPLLARGPQEQWSAFIEDLEPQLNDSGWKSTAAGQLPASEVENCHRPVAALRAIRPHVTLPDLLAPYQLWAPRVSRFSFSLSSHTTGAAGTAPADAEPASIN